MLTLFRELLNLFLIDLLFLAVVLTLLIPLFHFKQAAFAVLKRNFVGYFSNPTGYVFLCLFVLLSSFAAFWPHEFFTANLANLDQLNLYLPGIMLVFIPAITMSIWSEERRQGTDELLLTLPAADFDIVIGKYLAAAAIFTASLLFSQVSNFIVLVSLAMGQIDLGLFLTTYFGYWMTGLAMLSIGMVASFLTRNLTIGFILGVIFNMPLVFMKMADVLPSKVNLPLISDVNLARVVSSWSVASQFDAFGRGVISFSSCVYFLMIIVVGLYLSMVLIGARHWQGGRDGHSLLGHYLLRSAAMIVIALGLTVFFSSHDRIRFDLTEGQISSLSPDTKRLVRELSPEHPIYVDAFVSAEVPEQYAKTRLNLLSMLKEFEAMAGDVIRVNIHGNLEPFSEEAAQAEEQFGIRPQRIRIRARGALTDEEIILGAAFRCGLQKVVVPFFDYGIPVEYELIRSINTVAQSERKTIGVVRTDALLFGGYAVAGGQVRPMPRQAIVEELEKQYDVEEVDLSRPVEDDRYDLLLVAQPSSLSPEGMQNLLQAIRQGTPAAIFEDPLCNPNYFPTVPPTGQAKQAPSSGSAGAPPRTIPKADIRELWKLLEIQSPGSLGPARLFQPDLVWQQYNPYPKLQISGVPDQWVFVREEPGESTGLINPDNMITSGLFELCFPFPGTIEPAPKSELKFTKLVTTRELSGTIPFEQFTQYANDPAMLRALQKRRENLTIAALIESDPAGSSDTDPPATGDENGDAGRGGIKVLYCCDLDLMTSNFLRVRAHPDDDEDVQWQFENVTFLLNAVDFLVDDTDYIEIRKRKPRHATLQVVESRVEEARLREFAKRVEFQNQYEEERREAEAKAADALEKYQTAIRDLEKRRNEGQQITAELQEKTQRLNEQREVLGRRLEVTIERLQREREREVNHIRRDIDLEIQRTQFKYKFLAVAIPWIPPFLVGLVVFVRRRLREREGIEKSRLR